VNLNLYDRFWFSAKIQSGKEVCGVECRIAYPPQLLEAVLDENGGVQAQLGSFFSNGSRDTTMLNANLEDDKPGTLVLGLSKLGESQPQNGKGALFSVLFKCIGVGEGELRFEQSHIYNAEAKEVPSKWHGANLQVVAINVVSAEIIPVEKG